MDKKECTCVVDADGGCLKCKKELQEAFGEIAEAQLIVLDATRRIKGLCQGCHQRYADYAFAATLPAILDKMDREVGTHVVTQQLSFIQSIGFKAPLTRKVWRDHCAAQGWEDTLPE